MALKRRPTNAVEKVTEDLADLIPNRPQGAMPHLPEDITTMGEEELLVLFSRLTSWADYISVKAAIAKIGERDVENQTEVEEAKALVRNWGGTGQDRVTLAKARRLDDDEVARRREELVERYATRKLTETLLANVERDLFLVSRELSRRIGGQQSTTTKRHDSWRP